MVNVALRAAVGSGARYIWPSYFTKYFEKESFDSIFGRGDESCSEHTVEAYYPVCPPGGVKVPASRGRCSTEELLMSTAESHPINSAEMCGCKRAVIVEGSTLFWDHNYTKTASLLSRRYWRSHAEPLTLPAVPGSTVMASTTGKTPQVVMHVRLGDIETDCEKHFTPYNCRKKLQVEVYEQTLGALFSVLPPSCVDVNFVTDGHRDSPDIVRLMTTITQRGLPAPKIWTGSDLSTAKTFELLTHADVLVFGSSGFGRLAAILGRPETVRIGAPQPWGFDPDPVRFLPNTTQLRPTDAYLRGAGNVVFDMAEARQLMAKNPALQALAGSCGASGH